MARRKMNILVIKQTSLGDVLHASGHIRTIKQWFPDCRLTLLTAESSADIYRHSPWVDELILFESYRVKREWRKHPLATVRYIAQAFSRVRSRHFDLAFDLQGLAKSVIFLYFAHADKKYVKGNWIGLNRFRHRELHAIKEMDGVLRCAKIAVTDTSMELCTGKKEQKYITGLLAKINPHNKPLLLFSPFTRWKSKDWPLSRFVQLATRMGDEFVIAFTASADFRETIDNALPQDSPNQLQLVNLAGQLSLLQFAELTSRARLMLTGDSFPMHVACAKNTPVLALFAPTDESKTGPVGTQHEIIRAPDCNRCDRPNCPRDCLKKLPVDIVFDALTAHLNTNTKKS